MATPIDIVTIEMIKPSYPTPLHLRNLCSSFLDQIAPSIHFHIILYYEAYPSDNGSHNYEKTSLKLKRSLSEALVTYYPLAGRIRDTCWVDCNDAGAEYLEARFADIQLSDVIEKCVPERLEKYVPMVPRGGEDIPLSVQVNFFGCGGAAVGLCISHKVTDATNDTKSEPFIKPCFGSMTSRFPPTDFPLFLPPPPGATPANIVTKRYVFDEPKLATLKNLVAEINPTRVEAVIAFIWKNFIDAVIIRDKNKAKNTLFAAKLVVDIRSRASPPFPKNFFGNACARALAMTMEKETDSRKAKGEYTYHDLAINLRDAIRKIDVDYVKRMEDGHNFLKYLSTSEENDPCFKDGRITLETCGFSSWCRLPLYDVADYGWGKPVWVSPVAIPVKNMIVLLDTKTGNGIEAWVNMLKEDIALIDTNYHLISSLMP
ncbi:hypothetical protein ACJIZ3_014044 [Penstemon smallii]|uniref:Uncharacterized protein n=1 Tax=Penstemon smallii TaxID=265156 RepID=A0ABD3RLX1_9LAMI